MLRSPLNNGLFVVISKIQFEHLTILTLCIRTLYVLTIIALNSEQIRLTSFWHMYNSAGRVQIQWNLDNSKSKGPNSFVWIIETLNNWGLNAFIYFSWDFKMILNYWNFELLEFELSRLYCSVCSDQTALLRRLVCVFTVYSGTSVRILEKIRAGTWRNFPSDIYAQRPLHSNQPTHHRSLVRVFVLRMK